jgi:hypothetical protein
VIGHEPGCRSGFRSATSSFPKLEVSTMRLVSALAAVAVLAISAPAFAGQDAARPAANASAAQQAAQGRAADAAFLRVSVAFEGRMRLMTDEMLRARSANEMRVIEARYQPEANAFADAIDMRLAAEGRVRGPFSNARKVRNLPTEVRETLVDNRLREANRTPRVNASMNQRTGDIDSGRVPVQVTPVF